MENLEVVIIDLDKNQLNKFVLEELSSSDSHMKASHFYDSVSGQDVEFRHLKSIREVLSPKGTGHMVFKQLEFGILIQDVVIVFSFDERLGDVVFNFPDSNIFAGDKNITQTQCRFLLAYLIKIKEKYSIPAIKLGYEPAIDDDTCIISISEKNDIDSCIKRMLDGRP